MSDKVKSIMLMLTLSILAVSFSHLMDRLFTVNPLIIIVGDSLLIINIIYHLIKLKRLSKSVN